ncbi:MAG: hypothetical protein N3E49_09620, partial [Bacteroidia bacterium]|nr:hypothetical protein [Bacteroidia bacterium]
SEMCIRDRINAQDPAEYITRAEFEQKMQEIAARIDELATMVQNALAVLSTTPPVELEAAVRNARAYGDLITTLSQTQRLLTERMQASETK